VEWRALAKTLEDRTERVLVTMIAKKFLAWYVSTYLLLKHYITGNDWVILTIGIFGLASYDKWKGGGYGDSQYNRHDPANTPGAISVAPVPDDPDSGDSVAEDVKPKPKHPLKCSRPDD
jgi:hypothetical protein